MLTWTREDASLPSDVTSSPPLLSFPSLHTSHAGRYTCTARLNIPQAGVDISGDRTTSISIQCTCTQLNCHDAYMMHRLYFGFNHTQLCLHLPLFLDLQGIPVSSKAWTLSSPASSLWVMRWTLQSQYRGSGIGMELS